MVRSAAVALVGLLFASQVNAQAIDCPATSGSPVSLEAVPGGTFAIYAAVNSASIGQPFMFKDAQGHGVRTSQVEVTLPEVPASLVFNAPGAPKSVVLQVQSGCLVYPQIVVAGPEAGVFSATVRIAGTAGTFAIPVHVVATQSYVHYTYPDDVIARSGQVIGANSPAALLVVSASAAWSDGQGHFGPLGGVPMTFTAPSSGPTLQFANGTQQITVLSNSSGGVGASARTIGGTGPFIVRATYPDGGTSMVVRYVAVATPEVQVTTAQPTIEFGVLTELAGTARYAGYPCDLNSNGFIATSTFVSSNGAALRTSGVRAFAGATGMCPGGIFTAPFTYSALGLPFGTWPIDIEVTDRYPNQQGNLGSGRAQASITVLPAATVQSATGRGSIRLGSSHPEYGRAAGKCSVSSARAIALTSPDFPATLPDAEGLPFGALRFELSDCNWRSTTDFGVQPPPPPIAQRVLLEFDEVLPADMAAWAYGPTPDNTSPHWHELRTAIAGRFAQFDVINGSTGDDSTASDQVIRPLIALGVPKRVALNGSYQDLWWAGPAENGWGMTITQHRDTLFAALFIYDAQGDPRWLVMSGGAWNANHTVYSGEVYRPRGTPFAQNGSAAFTPGPSVGTLRLTPRDRGSMRLDYTIDGVSGSKQITRQLFGPPHPYPINRLDDLWWGGLAQNGWGFALAQQYRTFFGVIYTYDEKGDTTWYVAPAGSRQPNLAAEGIQSLLYQTRGAPWLGAAYDPSKLVVTLVGTLQIGFSDGWDTGSLHVDFERALPVSKSISRQPF